MKAKKVWKIVKLIDVHDRKLIGWKWMLKLKRNRVYRATFVALWYSQFSAIDFMEHSLLVINDIKFKLLLIIWLVYNYYAILLDVETAFLYGELTEEIYMKSSEGLENEVGNDECLLS